MWKIVSTVQAEDNIGKVIAYGRVSTPDQSLDLQIDAFRKEGVPDEHIFTDKVSAVARNRPGLKRAMVYLERGDTLMVWRLDRFARSISDLVARMKDLQKRGVRFRSLSEALDLETATGRLVLHIFGAVAEFERQLISERVSAGMQAAKQRGVSVGAQPKLKGAAAAYARKEFLRGVPAPEIVRQLKSRYKLEISPRTIYHRFKRNNVD